MLYPAFNLGATVMAVVCTMLMNHYGVPGKCHANIHWWNGIMTTLIVTMTFLGLISAFILVFYSRRMRHHYVTNRIALGQFELQTNTVTNKWLYCCMYSQDAVAIFVLIVGTCFLVTAWKCSVGYGLLYIISLLYETM